MILLLYSNLVNVFFLFVIYFLLEIIQVLQNQFSIGIEKQPKWLAILGPGSKNTLGRVTQYLEKHNLITCHKVNQNSPIEIILTFPLPECQKVLPPKELDLE